MHLLIEMAAILTAVGSITAFCVPILKSLKRIQDGQKSLLRAQMLSVYYKHKDEKRLHQYERENFDKLYGAYCSLHGNSFIEDIYNEIRDWEVTR